MSRYIDADALKQWIKDVWDWDRLDDLTTSTVLRQTLSDIDDQPTADVVEVVRCRDCKYGEVDDMDFPTQIFCRYNGNDWNEDNHYCSYGERREDDKGRNTTSV